MEKIQENKKKTQQPNQNQTKIDPNPKQNQKLQSSAKPLWDCGSTLYDSFELKSFERQLDSAIHSRTMSMPHLSDRVLNIPPPPPVAKKPSNKISRSVNKFLKSVFNKSKQNSRTKHDPYYVVYDKSGALTTIPEVPEIDFGGFSPEFNSLVGRTASDRFTATSIGISCA